MKLHYVPLLRIQRELQRIPRSLERFQQCLRTVLNQDATDVELVPLLLANPMAKDHVTAFLDALLAIDADAIGAGAAAEASAGSADLPGEFNASLVVCDDTGGWTNRWSYEYDLRRPAPGQKRFWVTAVLWSSEPSGERAVREAVLTAAYRTAYVVRHGPARTLRDLLRQEGEVMAATGCSGPSLDDEELAYTREVIAPHLDATDLRSGVECLFGDAAGRTLGFTPRGLSAAAGLALALHDAGSAAHQGAAE
jgi:hypothetical protein